MHYDKISVPADGQPITLNTDFGLNVPDRPIIPYVEGDGIGVDVSPVMLKVVNAAVTRAYGNDRQIAWMEIFAGKKASEVYDTANFLPEETLDALKRFVVSIKGPLQPRWVAEFARSTCHPPDTRFVCLRRPIRYFPGVNTPMKESELVDMTVFRENTEDIYAGIEYPTGSVEVQKLIHFLQDELKVNKIRFPVEFRNRYQAGFARGFRTSGSQSHSSIVSTTISVRDAGAQRQHHEVHRGAFCQWGYELARAEFGATEKDGGPWLAFANPRTGREIIIKDVIADNFLQQILMRPEDYDVIATLNLNGDYISDALAAQVGGIGIAPGGNIGDGVAVFEATHGTAPGFAGKDQVNPGSIILSAEMMLRYMGWTEAADYVMKGVANTIANKELTFDLARLRRAIKAPLRTEGDRKTGVEKQLEDLYPGATLVGTRGFGDAVIRHMDDE